MVLSSCIIMCTPERSRGNQNQKNIEFFGSYYPNFNFKLDYFWTDLIPKGRVGILEPNTKVLD